MKQFTATVYIIEYNQLLLHKHSKLGKWLPPGGHVEQDETPTEAAKREVFEETGLEIQFIQQENLWIACPNAKSFERPYMCLLENIPKYKNTPAHQHMDFIYLAKPLTSLNEEQNEFQWLGLDQILNLRAGEEIFYDTQQIAQKILLPSRSMSNLS